MLSLKELQIKRRGAQASCKITSAMKMVASSKLRYAQTASLHHQEMWKRWQEALHHLKLNIATSEMPLWLNNATQSDESDEKNASAYDVILIVTSERGLCGGFNTRLIKEARHFMTQHASLKFINIGKKIATAFAEAQKSGHVLAVFPSAVKNRVTTSLSEAITNSIMQAQQSGLMRIGVLMNKFVNALIQKPVLVPLLSINNSVSLTFNVPSRTFICEPDALTLAQNLLPSIVQHRVQMILWESLCSEHASRMNAMDQALRNANDMIQHLTLTQNRIRQARITRELIEVVSGAESMS